MLVLGAIAGALLTPATQLLLGLIVLLSVLYMVFRVPLWGCVIIGGGFFWLDQLLVGAWQVR